MLLDALDRYSSILESLGSTAPARLLPGDPPDEVRELLVQHGLEPFDDVVELFSWSQGTGVDGPQLFFEAVLSSVRSALELRKELLDLARIASHDDERASPDDFFHSKWMPIGPSDPYLVVDTGSGPTQGHVLAVWWDQPPTTNAISLEEFVESAGRQLVDGEIVVEADILRPHPVQQVRYPEVVVRIRAGTDDLIPAQYDRVRRAAAAAANDPGAEVLILHSSVGDIPDNEGLELSQRDLVVDALVAEGVDRDRITTQPVPLGENLKPTHHLLGVYLQQPEA